MANRWFVYPMSPIDMNWDFLDTVEETLKKMTDQATEEPDMRQSFQSAHGFLKAWDEARELAKANGWEGDFRGSPYVFWLPDEVEFLYGFAWKQDNNGSTFIISPKPLPHLNAFVF